MIEVTEKNEKTLIHFAHNLSDIVSLIRYKEEGIFGIEYKTERIYKYKSDDRDMILLNIQELCETKCMNCPILLEEPMFGVKEGYRGDIPHPEYSEYLLKKLTALDENWRDSLREFNMSFKPGFIQCKDKMTLRSVLKYLNSKDEDDLILVYSTVYRLILSKVCFEDIPNLKVVFQVQIMESLASSNQRLNYLASLIILEVISKNSSNEKSIQINQDLIYNEKE